MAVKVSITLEGQKGASISFHFRYSGEFTSKLPPVDIIITTSDPFKELAIMTVLAIDYPVQKFTCYVSDDGASPITFYSLVETVRFAKNGCHFAGSSI